MNTDVHWHLLHTTFGISSGDHLHFMAIQKAWHHRLYYSQNHYLPRRSVLKTKDAQKKDKQYACLNISGKTGPFLYVCLGRARSRHRCCSQQGCGGWCFFLAEQCPSRLLWNLPQHVLPAQMRAFPRRGGGLLGPVQRGSSIKSCTHEMLKPGKCPQWAIVSEGKTLSVIRLDPTDVTCLLRYMFIQMHIYLILVKFIICCNVICKIIFPIWWREKWKTLAV